MGSFSALFALSGAAAILMVAPGALLLRAIGFRWGRALLASTPVSGALYLLLATALPRINVSWGWVPVLVLIAVLAAVNLILYATKRKSRATANLPTRIVGSDGEDGAADNAVSKSADYMPAVVWALVAWGVYLLVHVPTLLEGMAGPEFFAQIGDAQFHQQGALLVSESGNASPFTALTPLYFSDGNVYYPTLWHSLVVLVSPGANIVLGTNAAAVAVGLILWPASIGTLASQVAPESRYSAAIAILAATPLVLMPTIQTFSYAVYPFVLSLVLVGPALTLMVWWVRSLRWKYFVGYLLAVAGGGAAQPGTGVLLLGLLAVALVVLAVTRGVTWYQEGLRVKGALLILGAPAVFVGALFAVPQVGPLRQLGHLGHPSVSYLDAAVALGLGNTYIIVDRPISGYLGWGIWLLVLAVLAVGLLLLLRDTAGRILVASGLLLFGAYLLASGPENYLRRITAIWWKDQTRFALYLLVIVIAAYTLGFVWLMSKLQDRLRWQGTEPAIMATWAAGSAVIAMLAPQMWMSGGRLEWLDRSYGGISGGEFTVDPDKRNLLNQLDQHTSDTDIIIGSPRAGVPWVNMSSNAGQFPLWKTETAPEAVYLKEHFHLIHEDPQVCEFIRSEGITMLLRDEGTALSEDDPHRAYNDVDVTVGFTPVANVGDVWLYRIDACQ